MLPADLSLLSSPVTFVAYQAKAKDGAQHHATVYFDASGEWVVNDAKQAVIWRRMREPVAGMQLISMGSAAQPILEKSGDNLRIDWGYLYVGVPADENSQIAVASHAVRTGFSRLGAIPQADDADMPRPADKEWPVIGGVFVKFLTSPKLWKKYAGRSETPARP